tara:strand:+ start:3216 stop:4121 length:906 start_codon:yes stop_codon:yes gene_type:complete
MSVYLLHDDQYNKGIFDFELGATSTFVGVGSVPTTKKQALSIFDPREFSGTSIVWGAHQGTNPPTFHYLDFILNAKENTTVDYIAFNKITFTAQLSPYPVARYLRSIEVFKKDANSNLTQLAYYANIVTSGEKNLVLKFDETEIPEGNSIVVRFLLEKVERNSNLYTYGSGALYASYMQVGKSTKLESLQAPFNFPTSQVYKTTTQKSDRGKVVSTRSLQQAFKIDLNLRNMTKDSLPQIRNMVNDLTKFPFFIYEESEIYNGEVLTNVPFCWLSKEMKSPKINTNHLYDLTIKAQGKIYE